MASRQRCSRSSASAFAVCSAISNMGLVDLSYERAWPSVQPSFYSLFALGLIGQSYLSYVRCPLNCPRRSARWLGPSEDRCPCPVLPCSCSRHKNDLREPDH